MKCPQCGTDMVASNANWLCPHCGHSMPKTAEAVAPAATAAAVAPPAVPPAVPVSGPVVPTVVSPVAGVGVGAGTKRGFGLPTWLIIGIAVPVLAVGVLISLVFSASINHERNLLKTGTVGQAIVTNSRVDIAQTNDNTNSGYGSNQSNVTTEVTYRLLNVPGYSTQTYSSSLGGNQSATIQAGQKVAVVYNPTNPGDNGLQQALQGDASPLALVMPWLFVVIPFIFIIVMILASRRLKQRHEALQDLQS